ncbi:hypothetical protein ACOME3_002512 [Neoechinorhynchus agilis]
MEYRRPSGGLRQIPTNAEKLTCVTESRGDQSDISQVLLYEKTKLLRVEVENTIRNLTETIVDQIDDLLRFKSSEDHHQKMGRNSLVRKSIDSQSTESNTKPKRPARKVFTNRTSILSDLFEFSHVNTIRHVFIAVMIIFALQTFLHDMIDDKKFLPDFSLIFWCFGKFSTGLSCWLQMSFLCLIVLYVGFYCWAALRRYQKYNTSSYDRIFISAFVGFIAYFWYFPLKCVITNKLPIATSACILMEQIRMIMKQYAFVRENAPRAMNPTNPVMLPTYSKYLYFLFAPTLVYRDEYPRTKEIRWHFVAKNLAEVAITILYSYYVFLRVSVARFKHFSGDNLELKEFLYSTFSCILPGSLLLLLVFYGFLHCWLNAFAEMLRFADRMFYQDWWKSTDYRGYYRTWNVVVHDWLYNYVYLDLLQLLGPKYKVLASFVVVLMSSLVHEYILTFMLGYFYPVNIVLFGFIGFLMTLIPKSQYRSNLKNILFWVTFLIGLGANVSMCSMGYFARKNCNIQHWKWGIILPRTLICFGAS